MCTAISRRFLIVFGILAILITSAGMQIATAQMRVGVFDSRALALARFRSADYDNPLKGMMQEMKAAKESGNDAEIARLNKLGGLHQAHMHDVVFGSGSINDCFAELKDRLSVIANEEHLDMIVSRWETAFVASDVVLVDITGKLVEYYHPDEVVQKMLEGLKTVEPVKDALFLED
ncbi:MAG: hypothetical protein IH600_09805 [Bacteroidetes bacterium]|nr:hypothetical protein [Bacteroidota bacterium]